MEETHLVAAMVVAVVGIVVSLVVAVARAMAVDMDPTSKLACFDSSVARKDILLSAASRGLIPHSLALLRRVRHR
jgi:hypothetical protein